MEPDSYRLEATISVSLRDFAMNAVWHARCQPTNQHPHIKVLYLKGARAKTRPKERAFLNAYRRFQRGKNGSVLPALPTPGIYIKRTP